MGPPARTPFKYQSLAIVASLQYNKVMSKGYWQRGIELRERTQEVLGTSSLLVRKHNKWYARTVNSKRGRIEPHTLYLGNSIAMAMAKLERLAKEGSNGGKES